MRAYGILLCYSSSVDRDTNAISAYKLLEEIARPTQLPDGAFSPFEAHVYLEECEPGQIEGRFVWKSSDQALEVPATKPFTIPIATARLRMRATYIEFPPNHGKWRLAFEHRAVGSGNWDRESITWPVDCVPELTTISTAPPAP